MGVRHEAYERESAQILINPSTGNRPVNGRIRWVDPVTCILGLGNGFVCLLETRLGVSPIG